MSKRLEFEKRLLDQRRRGFRRKSGPLRWVFCLVLSGVVVAACVSAFLTSHVQNRMALAQTLASFAQYMAAGNMDAALALCAEGEVGSRFLVADEARVFADGAAPPIDTAAQAARMAQLDRVRLDLERSGLDWASARPIAFGGVRARVRSTEMMQESATALIGYLYLESGGAVYGVELAMRECFGAYVIMDAWQWGPLAIAPGDARRHSSGEVRNFKRDASDAGVPARLDRIRHVFIRIG